MQDYFTESERHYISLLQDSISRMAANSVSCKTWLLTLIAAILALQISSSDLRNVLWVALGLIVLFYYLDSYYLGLERKFRLLEERFIQAVKKNDKLSTNEWIYSFNIESIDDKKATTCSALLSKSTLPFYLVMFLIVLGVCVWPIIVNLVV